MAKNHIINQVRIAILVSQSLLKKSSANGELPARDADDIMEQLNIALAMVKKHIPSKG